MSMENEEYEYEEVVVSKSPATRMAEALSKIFNPLLIPTYSIITALLLSQQLYGVSRVARNSAMVVTFALTCIVPIIVIYILIRTGNITDPQVNKQKERLLPFVATIICYIASAMHLSIVHAPAWLSMFMVGAAVSATIVVIVNLKWKISAHATAMGGFVALVMFMALNNLLSEGNILPMLTISILSAGAVCSSRLYLQHHDIWQILAGFANGFIVVFLITNLAF
ncbi:MAG: hypothetical protein IJC40_04880 [Muribaculaceae bacterium]|nr:hypothetical protein [Muribaculaceae bacterium]